MRPHLAAAHARLDYFAEPQATLDGRGVECARGKVIGGSSISAPWSSSASSAPMSLLLAAQCSGVSV
jgi:hypothetical protein